MKTRKYIFAALATCLLSFSSCLNDLDVLPLDPTVDTADKAYTDAASYTKGLHKIYSVWALSGQDGSSSSDISGLDPGNTALLRCWWTLQEQPTDEMKNAWNDAWCTEINHIAWTTNKVEPIEGVYQRCMYIVALVNEFLKNIPNAPAEVDKESYTAQARFNRAFAYYVLMDMFALPPFITEANYSIEPAPLSREELFNWIEKELNEIKSSLPAPRSKYGIADQAVANALLARMYLNAEVYTGKARYTDCVNACNEVIKAGYQLADNYADLFRADNGENQDTRKEIIYPIIFDGETVQSWGMAAIIIGARGKEDKEVLLAHSGVDQGWSGFRGTSNLVKLFDYKNNEAPKASEILDKRGIFEDKGRSISITTSVAGTFETEGWSVYKFSNLGSDGTPGKNTLWVDTDFPMFRLGDIYLMYAEAVARGGEGSKSTAVGYINDLRKRAYGDELHKVSESWLTENSFRNLLDERGREMYWEGVRRTDLVRFGLLISSSYTWDFKGGISTGVGVNKRYNVYPIPVTDLTVNGNLQQNEGY